MPKMTPTGGFDALEPTPDRSNSTTRTRIGHPPPSRKTGGTRPATPRPNRALRRRPATGLRRVCRHNQTYGKESGRPRPDRAAGSGQFPAEGRSRRHPDHTSPVS
ncbi:hypothetical protein GCM10028793_12700 [Nocardiopsis oceani]